MTIESLASTPSERSPAPARRRPDPNDARARIVTLTSRGREIRQKSAVAFRPVNDHFAAALTGDEIETLVSLLQRVCDEFERKRAT